MKTGKYSEHQNKEKINIHDLYDECWHGRDFEITHLWQRSIFLATFLLAFFTAYGALWGNVLSLEKERKNTKTSYAITAEGEHASFRSQVQQVEYAPSQKDILDDWHIQFGFCLISLGGCLFSVLWIQMAKGSKFWYEKYEKSIEQYVENGEGFDEKILQDDEKKKISSYCRFLQPTILPRHGYLCTPEFNDGLFSLKGGQYSLSKINIAIGWVFLVWWSIASLYHFFLIVSIPHSLFVLFLLVLLYATGIFTFAIHCIAKTKSTYCEGNNLGAQIKKTPNHYKKCLKNKKKWIISVLIKIIKTGNGAGFWNIIFNELKLDLNENGRENKFDFKGIISLSNCYSILNHISQSINNQKNEQTENCIKELNKEIGILQNKLKIKNHKVLIEMESNTQYLITELKQTDEQCNSSVKQTINAIKENLDKIAKNILKDIKKFYFYFIKNGHSTYLETAIMYFYPREMYPSFIQKNWVPYCIQYVDKSPIILTPPVSNKFLVDKENDLITARRSALYGDYVNTKQGTDDKTFLFTEIPWDSIEYDRNPEAFSLIFVTYSTIEDCPVSWEYCRFSLRKNYPDFAEQPQMKSYMYDRNGKHIYSILWKPAEDKEEHQ